MDVGLRVEDFGNGFRAYCHGSYCNGLSGVVATFSIGAIISKAHVLSRVPYFVASRVRDFLDEDGDYLYKAHLLTHLMNEDDEGYRSYLAVRGRVVESENFGALVGAMDGDLIWRRNVRASSFNDALERYWPKVEAEATALASITIDEVIRQALHSCDMRAEMGLVSSLFPESRDTGWLRFIRAREELRADEIESRDDRIRYLESRVVELKGRV